MQVLWILIEEEFVADVHEILVCQKNDKPNKNTQINNKPWIWALKLRTPGSVPEKREVSGPKTHKAGYLYLKLIRLEGTLIYG